jgi:hypothetical protein
VTDELRDLDRELLVRLGLRTTDASHEHVAQQIRDFSEGIDPQQLLILLLRIAQQLKYLDPGDQLSGADIIDCLSGGIGLLAKDHPEITHPRAALTEPGDQEGTP